MKEKEQKAILAEIKEVEIKKMDEVSFKAVDLGLPSGKLWADRNVGAEDAMGYGFLMPFDLANSIQMPDGWKVPSKDDFIELCNNCTHKWEEQDGIRGIRFISNINGASVFFPAAGYYDGTSLSDRGSYGYYWSSSFYSATIAYNLYFNSSGVDPQYSDYRRCGFSVRAVQ